MFPCNLGPLVVVHPDDVWYPTVDSGLAVRIVEEHLVDGRPVAECAMRRDAEHQPPAV
ncbi:MAG TPA: hypothetical protein VFY17_10440 [Pilimelia sp.]|nr:hypothetical protein [Pilimelia sp.]